VEWLAARECRAGPDDHGDPGPGQVLGSVQAVGIPLGRPLARQPEPQDPEIAEFIRSAPAGSGAVLAGQVADRFGVVLHRRTIERARGR
jgi:hypothetical protein